MTCFSVKSWIFCRLPPARCFLIDRLFVIVFLKRARVGPLRGVIFTRSVFTRPIYESNLDAKTSPLRISEQWQHVRRETKTNASWRHGLSCGSHSSLSRAPIDIVYNALPCSWWVRGAWLSVSNASTADRTELTWEWNIYLYVLHTRIYARHNISTNHSMLRIYFQ